MRKETGLDNGVHAFSNRKSQNYRLDTLRPRFILVDGENVNAALARHSSGISDALTAMHADFRTGREFIRRLSSSMVTAPLLDVYFSQTEEVLGDMAEAEITFDDPIMRLLAASMSQETAMFLGKKNYRKKLVRACVSFAKAGVSELQLPDPQESITAIDINETEAAVIGRKVLQVIRSTERDVAFSARSGPIEVTGEDQEKRMVHAEFYDTIGTDYARVGNIFFVDARFRNKLPQDLAAFVNSNIVFVKSMHMSELSTNIGYYTANTIASMMHADIEGKLVMDCGSGSGMLSLAAMRLGAKGVVAIEKDEDKVRRARKNLAENGYGDNPNIQVVHADLIKDGGKVLDAFGQIGEVGDIVIVTDIGSWSIYPISNLTSFSYIDDLNRIPGSRVATVVSGGHSYLEKTEHSHEARLLSTRGIDYDSFPREDMAFDQAYLEHLGFRRIAGTYSHTLGEPGDRSHTAKSLVMTSAS
jgi:SAM-dependent methyltransferase